MALLDNEILRDLTERLNGKEITAALNLAPVAKMSSKPDGSPFSSKGLPGYFCGNREAETVLVNLNPGIDAGSSNDMWDLVTMSYNKSSTHSFYQDVLAKSRDYGNSDASRYDAFDIKQAAFFDAWENSGIRRPANLNWGVKDTDAYLLARRYVLCDKLQLELVPYASSKFAVNKKFIHLFRPFVDTLLDEIFSRERRYVVFASAMFEDIFDDFNKVNPNTFDLIGKERKIMPDPLKDGGRLKGRCRVIRINYKGKSQKALIAYTFPSQALGQAFDLMRKYGEFCYRCFLHG